MQGNSKHFFKFAWFDELIIGDVFKFSPMNKDDEPSRFYTVYFKDESITKINSSYGNQLIRREFKNELSREVLLFPNR